MKRLGSTLIVMFLLFTFSSAQAGVREWVENFFGSAKPDLGTWYCIGCEIMVPDDPNYNTFLFGQVQTFVKVNNDEIFEGRIQKWKLGQSITVCDGTNCMRFFFEISGGITRWSPRTAARRQLSSDNPRIPANPSPQTSAPPASVGGGGNVEIREIMPGIVSITVPYIVSRILIPSVTVYQSEVSTTSIGPLADMPDEMQVDIGAFLDWVPESTWGLERGVFGGGEACSLRGCMYEN